jgi:hypothetical protein
MFYIPTDFIFFERASNTRNSKDGEQKYLSDGEI